MADNSSYIELDINLKLRKALSRISMFVRARDESERLENLEKAISLLKAIHRELLDTSGISGKDK
ncbi:MAG: hypothetical protein KAU14_05590 [Thermoplasmata archaeon]|nr:hypothetical protein [Thermoplasmata archaeon]